VHPPQSVETPAERLFGVGKTDWETLSVVQTCPPEIVDDDGVLPPGVMCLLLDHVIGSSISTKLDHHQRMVTSHMHLEYLRPFTADMGNVIGRIGEMSFVPGSAFCTGTASLESGELVSRFSARFAIFSGGEQGGGVVSDEVPPPLPTAPPVPHDWTASPIHQVLGTQVLSTEPSRVHLTFRAGEQLANERFGVHGGVGGVMGERACELAIRNAAGAGHGYRPVELRVLFVRPIAASGTDLAVDAEVGFLGRTTATTTARIYRPDGKLAVQVDGVFTR
jgi:uncharacterized protein (TIGR00369 family)